MKTLGKTIQDKIDFHKKMAVKMLSKYGGITGNMMHNDHMAKAEEFEKQL